MLSAGRTDVVKPINAPKVRTSYEYARDEDRAHVSDRRRVGVGDFVPLYPDEQGFATEREERITMLVRMELRADLKRTEEDLALAIVHLHPGRIVAAVDEGPHLPTDALWVHRVGVNESHEATRAAFREIAAFSCKRWNELTPDERIVRAEINRARLR